MPGPTAYAAYLLPSMASLARSAPERRIPGVHYAKHRCSSDAVRLQRRTALGHRGPRCPSGALGPDTTGQGTAEVTTQAMVIAWLPASGWRGTRAAAAARRSKR